MDSIDKRLINRIQSGFPVTSRPYRQLGEELGVTEEEVISRLAKLKKTKIVRRLGAAFDSKKLGFTSTLATLKVPPERIDEVAIVVNSYSGVTHNYLREDEYNMWFTITARSSERLQEVIEEIKQKTGLSDLLELPALKLFKIKVDFQL